LAREIGEGAFAVRMDVTDQESIDATVGDLPRRAAFWAFLLGICVVAAGLTFLETIAGRCAKLIKVRQA
jgi:preprotein translocase subunit SecD